jgi:anti-sigma-K factor RskA
VSNPDGTIHDHPLDDLAAYALDALDGSEREAVAERLTHCAACRDDLAAYHETLALLTPDEVPPAGVWERVAASIGAPSLPDPHAADRAPSAPVTDQRDLQGPDQRASAGQPDEAGPAGHGVDDVIRPLPSPVDIEARPRARRSRLRSMAAAGSVAAAFVGGVIGFALGSSGDDDTDIGTLAQQASEDPGGVVATLDDTGGQPVARVVTDEDGAYLVLEGLENLPEGRAYQLWSLTGPEPVSLGMLGRDGSNTVAFRLPPNITEVAISEAPTSGDAVPDGQFLASGSITSS